LIAGRISGEGERTTGGTRHRSRAEAGLSCRDPGVGYIQLEASGFADLAGIFITFSDPSLRDQIRLDSVTCVMDTDQVFAHPRVPAPDRPQSYPARSRRFDPARPGLTARAAEHGGTGLACPDDHDGYSKVFSTWSYETDQPLALEALRETLRKLPGAAYRAKRTICTTDTPQRRAAGRRVDIFIQEE
jgi:G3E family GTPase